MCGGHDCILCPLSTLTSLALARVRYTVGEEDHDGRVMGFQPVAVIGMACKVVPVVFARRVMELPSRRPTDQPGCTFPCSMRS